MHKHRTISFGVSEAPKHEALYSLATQERPNPTHNGVEVLAEPLSPLESDMAAHTPGAA